MIKDALSGAMLLLQDAYTLGDIIILKEGEGVVEHMNLLTSHIRTSPGNLITIRNGEINYVSNRSKDWSRMDLTIMVDYDSDIRQAMGLMNQVFQAMQSDSEWGTKLIGEPDILGIDQLEGDGVVLKIRTQTQPGKQFAIAREFRLRISEAFKNAGIKIPVHQQEIRYRN
jgi:moderate conductance mechanosensitive channel